MPAVPDGADGAADRDLAAAGQERDGSGRGGQPPGRADLAFPLAGVEDDRRRGRDAAQPGGNGVDPPRPQRPGLRQPGRDRGRGQQREHAGQVRRGQVIPARGPGPPGPAGGRPAGGADLQGGQPDQGHRQRPRRRPVQPDRRPAAQPRRQAAHGGDQRHRPGRDHHRGQQQPPAQLDRLAEQPEEQGELQPGPGAHRPGSGVNAEPGRSRTVTRTRSAGGSEAAARVTTGRAAGAAR